MIKQNSIVIYKGEKYRVIHVFEKDVVEYATGGWSGGHLGKINIQRMYGRPSWPLTVSKEEVTLIEQ